MHPILATPSARHLGHQFAAVLEEVQMSPAPFDGVVHSTQSLTVRTLKMFPWNVLESQFQALGFSLKAAFGHSPLPAQSKRCGKEFLRCHSFLLTPPSPKTQIPCLPPERSPQSFCG